ncbi:hypothetical protein TNCV_791691 [Trichonephila clavipes]|nr:hypothetical protein TNCV_791691 [Trichonephila clavipes]
MAARLHVSFKMTDSSNAGTGVYRDQLFFYASEGTAFDVEIAAICIALFHLLRCIDHFSKGVILNELRAALQAISSIEAHTSEDIPKFQWLVSQIL